VLYFIYRDKEEAFDFSIDKTKNSSPSIQPSFNTKWSNTCELFDKCTKDNLTPVTPDRTALSMNDLNECINNNLEPCLIKTLQTNQDFINGNTGNPRFITFCRNRGYEPCDDYTYRLNNTETCKNYLLDKCKDKNFLFNNVSACKPLGFEPCIFEDYTGKCDCKTTYNESGCVLDPTTNKYYNTITSSLIYNRKNGGLICPLNVELLFSKNNVQFIPGNSVTQKTECLPVNCTTSYWRDDPPGGSCYLKNGTWVKDQVRDITTPSQYGGQCITKQSVPCNAVNCVTSDWTFTNTTSCPKIQSKSVITPSQYGGTCDIQPDTIGNSITRNVECTDEEKCKNLDYMINYCTTTTDSTLSFYKDICKTKYGITSISCENILSQTNVLTNILNNPTANPMDVISNTITPTPPPPTLTYYWDYNDFGQCQNGIRYRTIKGCFDNTGKSYGTSAMDSTLRSLCGVPILSASCPTTTSSTSSTSSYTFPSDATLKQNINYNFKYGLKDLLELKPVKFDYIDDELGKEQLGFIAQDLKEIIPEAVSTSEYKGEEKYRINPSFIIPVLVNSVKELKSELDSLKSKLK
jgi:hypothetical protein